ncbi:lasso RiPP family leader peptide-containing protein [Streptomyces palmae]|uniref:Lasso RiPP family leader peptide-containing protein n=1 Tax=Streptomyces palmae TaxID=1701085 RepID=A0A4Z0H8A8_9ACTN|nr:lasso RiPP family leader peptide-containing protein [Streptomyces palmae]TGB07857.1 lasso RiPP family leader peptide-containing protein [Streptomyces palmae]
MVEESVEVYEPPMMVEAGEFAEVTKGQLGFNPDGVLYDII